MMNRKLLAVRSSSWSISRSGGTDRIGRSRPEKKFRFHCFDRFMCNLGIKQRVALGEEGYGALNEGEMQLNNQGKCINLSVELIKSKI